MRTNRSSARFAWALAAALCTALPPALARDWYVDINDVNCATGTGGPNDPFCNIGDALAVAADGDRIFIARGNYREQLTLDADLTLRGTGGPVIVDANGAASPVVKVSGGTTVELAGLQLINSRGRSDGGGLLLAATARATLEDCILRDNVTFDGGGVFNRGQLTLSNTTIRDNEALEGAGVVNTSGATLTMVNATIRGNTSFYQGAGLLNRGTASITDTTIRDNYSHYIGDTAYYIGGGGILNHGTLTLTRSALQSNTDGYYYGGGIDNRGTATLIDCLVSQNSSSLHGGGIFNQGTLTLVNTTVADNHGWSGGGVYNGAAATASLDHVIVAGNGALTGNDCQGTFTSHGYNLIGDSRGCNLQGDLSGNLLDVDPRFQDPSRGDFTLQEASPAVDAGDPAVLSCGSDLAGNSRFLDGDLDRVMIQDMGSYEFTHVRLEVTGDATPGGTLTVEVTGSAGMNAFLWVGTRETELLLIPMGCLALDLSSPWLVLGLGQTPVPPLDGTIPSNTPVGTTLVVQALSLAPAVGKAPGNLSNPVVLVVE